MTLPPLIFLADSSPLPVVSGITVNSDTSSDAAQTPPPEAPAWTSFIYIGLILSFLYFAVLRPQQNAKQAQEELLKTMKTGDKVVTSGGILGVIAGVEEETDTVFVKVADNVKIKVKRTHILEVVNKEKEKPKTSA